MQRSNFERLIQLADEVFAVKSDPNQLDVNPLVRERLLKIHPATLSEYSEGDGPLAWLLLIPTTIDLMNRFVKEQINEKELFEMTPLNCPYEAVYLCSALVLEEYRRKGITRRLALSAIREIQKKHPIKAVFVWAFSDEGDHTAEMIAENSGLPLFKRKR
jgi:GNAT superfamily N-acetyltransferase